MIIKKKQLITATLALALGAAIFVNWYYSEPQKRISPNASQQTTQSSENTNLGDAQYVSATTASAESVAGFKLKRETAHDKAKETYNSVIKDSASSAQAVAKATESLSRLAANIKDEADLENLITAKISGDCIVILDEDVCQVIVAKGSSTPIQVCKLRSLL